MKKILLLLLINTPCFAQKDSLDCNEMTYSFDKFKNIKSWQSEPYKEIKVRKYIENGRISNYLCFSVNSSVSSIKSYGVYLIFDDGKSWKLPNTEVDVDYGDEGFNYSYWRKLTIEDIKILKTKRITDFKLDFIDREVPEEMGNDIKKFVNCLGKLK